MSEDNKRPDQPAQNYINGRHKSAKELGHSKAMGMTHKYNHALDTLITVLRQVTEEIKNSEAEIKQLKQENKSLQAKNDALVARVARLIEARNPLSTDYSSSDIFQRIDEIICETPSESLTEIKAAAVAEFAVWYCKDIDDVNVKVRIRAYANILRQQGKKL